MSEQAYEALDNGIHGLADFLTDDPETESENEELASDTEPDESETQDESEETEQEESEEEAAEETAPRTFKVSVKGDDGADAEVEVSEDELLKGYQRQADYTRKTQELSHREQEVTNLLQQKFTENRDYYLHQAEAARAAVLQIAGIKSQQELAEMAINDPAGWVAEQQRQQYIGHLLTQMDQGIAQERQQMQAQNEAKQKQTYQKQFQESWSVLQKEGIDRDSLTSLYADVSKAYGFSDQELKSLLDARSVLVLRDAMKFRTMQSKAKEVTKVAKEAPRMPQKQTQPQNTRREQALDQKFKSGKAKLNDLAALLR